MDEKIHDWGLDNERLILWKFMFDINKSGPLAPVSTAIHKVMKLANFWRYEISLRQEKIYILRGENKKLRKELREMAKQNKRGKRRLARLKKKLGFFPKVIKLTRTRFGTSQNRVNTHGKACMLDKSKREISIHEDRKQKQRGWDV